MRILFFGVNDITGQLCREITMARGGAFIGPAGFHCSTFVVDEGCRLFTHECKSAQGIILINDERIMPELFRMFGMKFFFYSLEHLPIHVRNADGEAKFELEPVSLIFSKGMKPKDLVLAEALVVERKDEIIAKWKEIHGNA